MIIKSKEGGYFFILIRVKGLQTKTSKRKNRWSKDELERPRDDEKS